MTLRRSSKPGRPAHIAGSTNAVAPRSATECAYVADIRLALPLGRI